MGGRSAAEDEEEVEEGGQRGSGVGGGSALLCDYGHKCPPLTETVAPTINDKKRFCETPPRAIYFSEKSISVSKKTETIC